MKKGNLLINKKKVKRTTFTIVLLVVVTLISSSSISVKLKNISNNKNSNLEVIKEETSKKVEPSTGLAPSTRLSNPSTGIAPSIINIESQSISGNMPQLPANLTIYGYNVLTSPHGEGPCKFNAENPGDIIQISNEVLPNFASGGVWTPDERWIVCEYGSGILFEIDPDTGEYTTIGGGGVGLNGLAYDPVTEKLYGASSNILFEIDMETGEQEIRGFFGSYVLYMIAISFDANGVLYGWDLGDKLWTIDTETGEATEVGPLGIDINYAQDGVFDMENDILYLTAFTLSPQYGGFLYECDEDTGACTLVGSFEGSAEIDASMIRTNCCIDHDVYVKDIISPKDGYAGEDMDVIVQVANYGNASEYDVMVNVVILKDGIDVEYNESVYIDIDKGKIVDVEMPVWTPDDWHSAYNEYIDYKITAHAKLYGDDYPNNNYKEKWFELYFGYFHDVGCTKVIRPESGPAQTFLVNVTIKNLGQYDECCFKTYVEIAELDIENQVELLTEDFSDSTFPPNGWTRTHENWKYSNSNYAGGSSGEARFYYYPKSTDYFRLYTPAIDTSDFSAIEIEFKHFVDHNTTPYSLQIETSDDGINWDVVWDINPTGDIGPETIYILTAKNIGSTTYVSWTFNGNSSNIYYWFIDDIIINGYNSFESEYEDYHCTTMIEPGKENKLEFDEWIPDYLQYETTGTKKYIVKAWTDMNNPPDENPDNDLFVKSIVLDYFHDVGIKEITRSILGKTKHYAYTDGELVCWEIDGNFTILGDAPGTYFLSGGTWTPDKEYPWWVCEYGVYTNGSAIWRIDTNGDYEQVTSNCGASLHGMAYDPKTWQLFGCDLDKLYTIDMETGEATLVGNMNGRYFIGMGINEDGQGYGTDIMTDCLYKINLDDASTELVGSLGINLNYAQDCAFDIDAEPDVFYLVAFTLSPMYGPGWYICDTDTGDCTLLGISQSEMDAYAISATFVPPIPDAYVSLGTKDIHATVENIGTFPELDLTCYAEIYEYIPYPENGTLVYEDNITNIDLDEPLGGTELLNFNDYNFEIEGIYSLCLDLPLSIDDYQNNNQEELVIGADDTPPTTWAELEPPDGENGWYVSNVWITICALDPEIYPGVPGSGVKEIIFRINGGSWMRYPNDCVTVVIDEDGRDIPVEYYAIDNVGNIESIKLFTINLDKTKPDIEISWKIYKEGFTWYLKFTCEATDATSGMDRVEMYINDTLYKNITGPGPIYEFVIEWSTEYRTVVFRFVTFDKAGNSAYRLIKGSDIKSHPRSKSSIHQSVNIWLIKWFDRFPFFQKILTLRGWN